ncbi:MAG: hypothetical protein JO232_13185 [Verrucomicrobia bacterium]|nr:hypothetical protein [Verrucomicrobiota bacterium]
MQAEARLYLNGRNAGVISADRAADRMREDPELQAEFCCPRCFRPYVAVAIHPRKEPFQVSPHFRLRDGEAHKDFCPNGALNQNAKSIHALTRGRVSIEILGTIPQVLELPRPLEDHVPAPSLLSFPSVAPKRPADGATPPARPGKVKTNSVKGVVQFRNDRLREIGDYKRASEILNQIPLQLPGPPPYRLTYEKAFRKLTYPTPYHRIVYGIVFIESLQGNVRLSSQEVVASTNHPYPSAAGKRALIHLPRIEECASSDDVAFLERHEQLGDAFKIYFYTIPTAIGGSLVYHCQYWQLVEFRPLYSPRGRPAIELKF